MKKVLRITGIILTILLLLILGAAVAVQSPRVQTALARKALDMLSDKADADITFGKISVKPFDAVYIEDLCVKDRNPYAAPAIDGYVPVDTFAFLGSVSARFSLKGLFKKEGLHFSKVCVEDGILNLVVETRAPDSPYGSDSGNVTNIQRIFRIRKNTGEKKEQGSIFDIREATVRNFTFRLRNPRLEERYLREGRTFREGGINWNDMEVVADVDAEGLKMAGGLMEGRARNVSLKEKSGLSITSLQGVAKAGKGVATITDIRIRDGKSDIHVPSLILTGTNEDFGDFEENVIIDAILSPSVIDMPTIAWFAPALKSNTFNGRVSAKVSGTVDKLSVNGLSFTTSSGSASGQASVNIKGLPDTEGMILDATVKDFRFTTKGLGEFIRDWAPRAKVDLSKFARGTAFSFSGKAAGKLDDLKVDGTLSGAGEVKAALMIRNLIDKDRDIAISGTLGGDRLDLRKITGADKLGHATFGTALEAVLTGDGPVLKIDSLKIDRLGLLGYDYTGIQGKGTWSGSTFDGRITCNDPNLNFLFQGVFDLSKRTSNAAYQFYANVGYADLNALHLDNRGPSKVSFQTNANFIRTIREGMIGDISLAGLVLENEYGKYDLGEVSVQSHSSDGLHRIKIESGFADATFSGTAPITDMVRDLQGLTLMKELPSLYKDPSYENSGASYDILARLHDTRELLAFVAPGTYIADNSAFKIKISGDGIVDGGFSSGRIAFKDKYFKDLSLAFNNRSGGLTATLSGKEARIGGITLLGSSAKLYAADDAFTLNYGFYNGDEPENSGRVHLDGTLSRTEEDSLAVTVKLMPSRLCYNGDGWDLSSGDVTLRGSRIRVDSLLASCNGQRLTIGGAVSPSVSDTLGVDVENFDLALLNNFTGGKFGVSGKATGKVLLTSPLKPVPGILAGLHCDGAALAGRPMGRLDVSSDWDSSDRKYLISATTVLDGRKNLDLNGFYRPSDKKVSMLASLDGLDLGYAAPILEGVFRDVGGGLYGLLELSGTIDKPHLESRDTEIRDGRLTLDYTNVPYKVSGPFTLSENGLAFNDIALSDRYEGRGTVSGGLTFDSFKDLALDTRIRFTDMECLDTPDGDDFYGNVFATGRVAVTGPLNDLTVDIVASTGKRGTIHIPLGYASAKAKNLLTFVERDQVVEADPYDLMMNTITGSVKKKNDLDVKLRVTATPDITAKIEVDRAKGNVLTGVGNGTIDIESRSRDGLFTINGNYTLTSGSYKLNVGNIVSRDFTIRDGSSLRFNGDVMDTDLDIDGLFLTKASLSTLLADTTSTVTRRSVECGISITEKLRNPAIELSINVPDLDPTTQTQVEAALNTEDKVQKQFIYLLLTGGFLPSEESGIVNNSGMLYSNASNIMANQLNSIFEKLDIPLDLGLNYQSSERGTDIFDVALSTQLFNNRVVVNGTLGNRMSSVTGTDDVVGDLDIEVKLNRPGTLRLNLFSHSADQYTNYLDNTQRNGAGLSYQREFYTFRQLIRSMFVPQSRRNQGRRLAEDELPAITANRTVIEIGPDGKAAHITQPERSRERERRK